MRLFPLTICGLFIGSGLAVAQVAQPSLENRTDSLSMRAVGAIVMLHDTVLALDGKVLELTTDRDKLKSDLDAVMTERDQLKKASDQKAINEGRPVGRSKPKSVSGVNTVKPDHKLGETHLGQPEN